MGMKALLTFVLVLLISMGTKAQEKGSSLYLLFEFMQVNSHHSGDSWQVEDFWSGIHKQRVADKSIIGWDLWSLSPNGTEQGSQYLTVTLFSSLQNMLQAINGLDVMAYAKKAYPRKTDKELGEMFNMTGKARDLANQLLLKQVDQTKGAFTMKVGTIATMDFMKQLDDSYEKAESEIFKPWHQEMVTQGKKGSWELLRAILPQGTEAEGTHITVSMYNDVKQLSEFMESPWGELDMKTSLAVKEGLKTREWKESKIATLQMIVR